MSEAITHHSPTQSSIHLQSDYNQEALYQWDVEGPVQLVVISKVNAMYIDFIDLYMCMYFA